MGKQNTELFSSRQRIRKWKSVGGVLHLATICGLVLSLLWILPKMSGKNPLSAGQEVSRQMERRQLLVEALDKFARYENYYNEVHGRFTRDVSRLPVPEKLTIGTQESLKRDYEISALEVRPNRFILLATGIQNGDRITIDESYRLNANFVLPPPSRSYLLEEADRMLQLRSRGLSAAGGVFDRYWNLVSDEAHDWVAMGVRRPVLGEKREMKGAGDSLFATVSERVMHRMGAGDRREPAAVADDLGFKKNLDAHDVKDWLEAAHLAQHVHLKERGRYARRWEELDEVSNYHFVDRMKTVKNVRVHPIDLSNRGFTITLEGTAGDLLGEQFLIDGSGSVRQVRYTEALIQQLQETTNILENFQINPIVEEAAPAQRP